MPTLPSKEELKSMMYRDLQKICKDWGVRANLKSDEMIDLLLEAQSKCTPAPASQLPMQQRSVSTRRSSRPGPSRISSVIIHDIPEELPQKHEDAIKALSTTPDASVLPALAPPTRKKAKELQRRLGVGRPVAAGGTGPRAVTRSTTISHEKKLKGSRSIKQREATIQEEPESQGDLQGTNPSPQPQPVTAIPAGDTVQLVEDENLVDAVAKVPDYQQLLSDIVKPLQDQIETLRAEVRRLQEIEQDVYRLRDIVQRLQEEMEAQKRPLPLNPSTPPTTLNLGLMPSPLITMHPGASPILLGKRPREPSTDESLADGGGNKQEDTLIPVKKRPKLSEEISYDKGKEAARDNLGDFAEPPPARGRIVSTALPRATSFIVYNDPDEEDQILDSPPPNNLLPDYYTSQTSGISGSPRQGRPTSSANAPENQNPFNFSFLPAPSTPGPSLFMPAFPYPEPPQSPTPTGGNLPGSLGNTSERTDVFKSFGLPPPDRAARLPASSDTINPAALSQRDPSIKQRQPSSNEIGAGLGLIPSTSGESVAPSGRDPTAVKKTMYGTELDADTRFGDFGVEGVATGFWAGGRF
ncbi:hypothetical protein P691DRAFT_721372 [Macrolepiota fuliginosa MF-IS2]|uniref:Uncharacterized protein n=1 Tax=Macrolepiota fuliginosa MF-IS2 TaxID=1400762 RepID=A0A9P5XJJ1_9AGAR|nr:hypothetical protein P691DRAFT_721372 [Macrolepiota fuliginosa MF-IS2]